MTLAAASTFTLGLKKSERSLEAASVDLPEVHDPVSNIGYAGF